MPVVSTSEGREGEGRASKARREDGKGRERGPTSLRTWLHKCRIVMYTQCFQTVDEIIFKV